MRQGNGIKYSDEYQRVLGELRKLLEREKEYLQSGEVERLGAFAREKMQLFANLNHLAQKEGVVAWASENQTEVGVVNKMLLENLGILKFRMDAISEISRTIEDAIHESESDGTYNASGFGTKK